MGKAQKKYDPLEKLVFYLGLLTIAALIGYLAFQWAANEQTRPRLLVDCEFQPNAVGQVYRVEVENTGDITAENIKIQLGLFHRGKVMERIDLDIQYVPAGSRETGWITLGGERRPSDSLGVISILFLEP